MINTIINAVINLIVSLVSTILTPIDNLIASLLPSLSTALSSISSFFEIVGSSLGWVLSVFGLSSECLSFIVAYFTFKLTAPLAVSTIKLAIKWYNSLKL